MDWNISQAKQKFSEVVHAAGKEPQLIYNRNKIVAAVIDVESYKEYLKYAKTKDDRSIGSIFKELRDICNEEKYALTIPERKNREFNW